MESRTSKVLPSSTVRRRTQYAQGRPQTARSGTPEAPTGGASWGRYCVRSSSRRDPQIRVIRLPLAQTTKTPLARSRGVYEFVSTVRPVCGKRRCPDRNCCRKSCPRASCVTRAASSLTRSSRSPGTRPDPFNSRSSSFARRRRSRCQAAAKNTAHAIAAPKRPKKMRSSSTEAVRLGNAGTTGDSLTSFELTAGGLLHPPLGDPDPCKPYPVLKHDPRQSTVYGYVTRVTHESTRSIEYLKKHRRTALEQAMQWDAPAARMPHVPRHVAMPAARAEPQPALLREQPSAHKCIQEGKPPVRREREDVRP